jgi:hypothetical protein
MGTLLDDLERQARALAPREKATLARILIAELLSTLKLSSCGLLRPSCDMRLFLMVNLKLYPAMRSWQELAAACNDRLSLPTSRRRDDRSISVL